MKLKKSLYAIMVVLLMGILACGISGNAGETEVVETEVVEAQGSTIELTETVEPAVEGPTEVPDPDPGDAPAGSDPAEGSSDVPLDGSVVSCADGQRISDLPINPAKFDFDIKETFAVFTVDFKGQAKDKIYFAGVDFQSLNGPQTGPIPGFALGEGMTFGVSAAFQGSSILEVTAARAGENGELLPWTTAATAEIEDQIVIIEFPLSEIPGEVEMVRFTFSNGEICELSGIFGVDLGYVRPSAMRLPTLDAWNVVYAQENICFPDVCFNLPAGAGWNPTGENTGNVTLGEDEFSLQVYTAADGADNVVKIFEDTGWTPVESRGYKSPLGPFSVYDLESFNEIYGALGMLETLSGENLQTTVVAATGQTPLSEATQESLNSFMDQVMDSVRPRK